MLRPRLPSIVAVLAALCFAPGFAAANPPAPSKAKLGEKIANLTFTDHQGKTLAQVKAAKPTMDFDPEYGREPGVTAKFVEAVYRSLKKVEK